MSQETQEVAKDKSAKMSKTSQEETVHAKDKSAKVSTASKVSVYSKDRSAKVSTTSKVSSKSMSSEIARKMSREMDRIQNYRDVRKMVDRRHTHTHGAMDFAEKRGLPNSSNDFVYVNSGYTGSEVTVAVHSRVEAAPTSVVREQYWACSRWPWTQRALALTVGVLLGAVIGLAVTIAIRGGDDIADFFRNATPG